MKFKKYLDEMCGKDHKKKKKKVMEDSSQDAREVLETILDALMKSKDSSKKAKQMYDFGEELEAWHDRHESFTKKQAEWIWKTSEAMFGKKKK